MDLKLGKLAAVTDERTIPLSKILKVKLLPELPPSYDLHQVYGINDHSMFANDQYGDCVKAARAHQTLVFEAFEQGYQIEITDQEVVDEYFNETGGADSGLVLLYSLKDWRNDGWLVGGKIYKIYAFAATNGIEEFKHTVHLLGGPNFGVKIYETDMEQYRAGQKWHLTSNDGNLLGGHGLYAPAYTVDTGICMTWGKRQEFDFDWFLARSDESYAIVDNRNHWQGDSPVDTEYIDAKLAQLAEITGQEEDEPAGCCPFSRIARLFHGRKRIQKQL